MSRYTKTPRLEAAARECGGFNEETYRSIPDWEQELWCSRAWAAIETWAEYAEPLQVSERELATCYCLHPMSDCTADCTCPIGLQNSRTDNHGPHED